MNPRLSKRLLPLTGPRRVSFLGTDYSNTAATDTSVRDEAALLLSLCDIAESEIKTDHITDLWSDVKELPDFPLLPASSPGTSAGLLTPRSESLTGMVSLTPSQATECFTSRFRSVSVDETLLSPAKQPTPVITPQSSPVLGAKRRQPPRKTSQRQVKKAKYEDEEESDDSEVVQEDPKKKTQLQGNPPKGVPITKIMRRKFSWKNYPELEKFLIVNREEYLRHSALNYTVQQKQYNNRLTERLLELATTHGYIFDTTEFGFVTVRDRIRCYYKSYVQSAKKRGILMGYAARKAGLLSEEELKGKKTTATRLRGSSI